MASKFSCVQKSIDNKSIFYFSAEIGLTSSIPTYSGGLGVLAGDHIKAGADEEIPIDLLIDALSKDKKNTSEGLKLILPNNEKLFISSYANNRKLYDICSDYLTNLINA